MNKELLKQTREWYLWHNIKNENALLPVIVISCLVIFLHNGILYSACIWLWYANYCSNNNEKLNRDPKILKEREFWIESHRKAGNLQEYKSIIGLK